MNRIGTWLTEKPAELRRQLAQFEGFVRAEFDAVTQRFAGVASQFADVAAQIAAVVAGIPTTLPPSGAAGGALTGTYPNPSILNVTVPGRLVDLSEWHRLDPWTIIRTDFTECTTDARQYCGGFVVNAETGGTLALGTAVSDDNPGELAVTSIASGGSGVIVSAGTFFVGGDEYVVSVFLTPSSFTTHRMTIGFFQAIAATGEPTDGCYLWLSTSATLTGKCASGGVRTSTGTTVNLAVDTRYTAIVRVNAAKTSCYFAVYNAAGALVWTNTAASNLPGAIALYCGVKITSASATALARGSIDYLEARVGGPGRALGRYLGSAAEVLQ